MTPRALTVNGRFLRATPVGLHRVARSMLDAGRDAGLPMTVLAPPGVSDPRVDRHVWGVPGRFGDHAWEQGSLPLAARDCTVLSLANTAPLLARRSVVLVHDLGPLVNPHWYARSVRVYGQLVLLGARRATLVLTVSHAVAGELASAGIRGARIRVIHPAVDSSFTPASAETVASARARYGLARPYALVTGWTHPRKDVATAVAAHLLARRSAEHDLVLVGRGDVTFAPVMVPAAPTIRRLGYVPDADLPALLTGAAVSLYPSRYEGFGLPPLEASACGTPALVTDLPVLRESTGGRGVFLPAGDVAAWADALAQAVRGELEPPTPATRTWTEVGAELREVLGFTAEVSPPPGSTPVPPGPSSHPS